MKKLHEATRKYIQTYSYNSTGSIPMDVKMQVTLSVIQYVKEWNAEKNREFWAYILLQYGYRDSNEGVLAFLQTCVEDALKRNRKLFITEAHGRAFRTSILIHALSPKQSWMHLFDFLFDFYKDNLDWNIIPNDPLIDTMIHALREKLSGAATSSQRSDDFTISSKVYNFQVGIRKMVIKCPNYSANLFERLITVIDRYVNAEEFTPKRYEEKLCEEWFNNKISSIATTKRKNGYNSNERREIVTDYSRIHPRIIWNAAKEKMQLVIPDIRLKTGDVSKIFLVIRYGESIVSQYSLDWYGNELGKTIIGKTIDFPDNRQYMFDMNIKIQIFSDEDEIYNSGNLFYDAGWIFESEKRIDFSKMKERDYILVIPENAKLSVENVIQTRIETFTQKGFEAYFLELQQDYLISINGKICSYDYNTQKEIRVISPVESESLPILSKDNETFYFAYQASHCYILLGNEDASQKVVLMINGHKMDLSELIVNESNEEKVYICPLTSVDEKCHVQIINLEKEKIMYDRKFVLIHNASFQFNREFYYSYEDYQDSYINITIDDLKDTYHFNYLEDEIIIPYKDYTITLPIPCVKMKESTGSWIIKQKPVWFIKEIPQGSMLFIDNPFHFKVTVYVGDIPVECDSTDVVTLGNLIWSLSGNEAKSLFSIKLHIQGKRQNQEYILTKVSFVERFLKKTEFWYKDNGLFWNKGGMFIGNPGRTYTFTIYDGDDSIFSTNINDDTERIILQENIEVKSYRYEISITSGGVFKKIRKVIDEGICFIGDIDVIRFDNATIILDSITDDFKEEEGQIPIRTCKIDQIKYLDKEDTSEGYCPVYSGILYSEDNRGRRYDFSSSEYESKKGIKKLAVNPVRIVYINDTTLCITDGENDGLYYYSYYDHFYEKKTYAITDREYNQKNKKNYSNADLYTYHVERSTNV